MASTSGTGIRRVMASDQDPSSVFDSETPSRGAAPAFWLCVLLAVAAIPRLVVASRATPICDDGYVYLAVSEALDHGAYDTALLYLNVNVYPVVLVIFHGLGLAVIPAAKYWGAVLGALTVLPLVGWLRRVLGEKIALASGFVFAVHPEFIDISIEPIRDTTFWFLTALALYLGWRAAQETRLWLYATAGAAVALAAHTRTEGWLLVLPMILWPIIQLVRQGGASAGRVIVGLALACAMTPVLLASYNLIILRDHSEWEFGKLEYFEMAYRWFAETATGDEYIARAAIDARDATDLAEATHQAAAVPLTEKGYDGERKGTWGMALEFFDAMVQSCKPIPMILLLIGAIRGWRLLRRPENIVLSAMFFAIVLAIWIRLTSLGEINGRYFLTCFFPAAGSIGIGLITVWEWTEHLMTHWASAAVARRAAIGILGVIGLLHVGDAVLVRHPSRVREASIGRSLAAELPGDHHYLVLPHAARVGYYAAEELPTVILDHTPVENMVKQFHLDVAIFEQEFTPERYCRQLAAPLLERGWKPYDITHIPESEHFLVYVKSGVLPAARNKVKTASSVPPRPSVNR